MIILNTGPAYEAIRAQAESIGWPTIHQDDLYKHDKARLKSEDAPKRFGWVLRDSGTEILDTRMQRRNLLGYLAHYKGCLADGLRFHVFHSNTLIEVAFDEFERRLLLWNGEDEDPTPTRSSY